MFKKEDIHLSDYQKNIEGVKKESMQCTLSTPFTDFFKPHQPIINNNTQNSLGGSSALNQAV